jgi:hypothetical protein
LLHIMFIKWLAADMADTVIVNIKT